MKQKIFVILIILFFAIFTVRIYSAVMTAQCEETVLPDSIAPKEIIYLLETYWNSGNEKGYIDDLFGKLQHCGHRQTVQL